MKKILLFLVIATTGLLSAQKDSAQSFTLNQAIEYGVKNHSNSAFFELK